MERKKLVMSVFIVLLLMLLGTIAGVSIYTYIAVNSTDGAQEIQAAERLTPDQITTYKIDAPFKTNLLKGEDGNDHVISVLISFAISNINQDENKKLTELLDNSKDMAKSRVLRVIRDKTYEELSQGGASQELLANDILAVLQESFETNLITEVFVSEMYVY